MRIYISGQAFPRMGFTVDMISMVMTLISILIK